MRIDSIKFISELKRQDMTQKQVAEISGISRGTVNGIASGRSCSPASAKRIADALGVDLNDLLTDQEVQHGRS